MTTIYYNGTFISCENHNRIFSVLVTDGDKIVYTGSEIPSRFAGARRINMNGRCVVPAFSDTHIHFESYALFSTTADVRSAENFEEMSEILNAYISTTRVSNFSRPTAAAPTQLPKSGCRTEMTLIRWSRSRCSLLNTTVMPLWQIQR